jgi:hypothetical protein
MREVGVWLWRRRYTIAYVVLALRFVSTLAAHHDPRTGFTPLVYFGERFQRDRISQLADVPIFTARDSDGYDGQFYAQLAAAGNPFNPELRRALDSPPYRSQRILLPLAAHLAGLGRPAWALAAYALANLVCWLALAVLLARWWFPPANLHNLLRWIGTLFGSGMILSVTRSLVDGPALLAIAIGVRAVERNRHALAAVVLAAAGLVRETSVLAAQAFVPSPVQSRRAWLRAAALGLVTIAPAALWAVVLHLHYGSGGGARNIALPFSALPGKLHDISRSWRAQGWDGARDEVLVLVSLAVQVVSIAARPRVRLVWWRVGAAFAFFSLCLGPPVWEGSPSAATRSVLPLTLAFNVLAPETPAGLALLAAGNLTVLSAPELVADIPGETRSLGRHLSADYRTNWFGGERLGHDTWRWSSGDATLVILNESDRPVSLTLTFGVRSVTDRSVVVRAGAATETVPLAAQRLSRVQLGPFVAPPGETPLTFTSAEAPWTEPGPMGRKLTVAVYNLTASVTK